jgi:hypothetical protein
LGRLSVAVRFASRRHKSVIYHRLTRLSNLLSAFALYFFSAPAFRIPDPWAWPSRRPASLFMTHCVTNPHLTAFGPARQIRSTLFFLTFCVFRIALDNEFSSFAAAPCARHKRVDYHYLFPPSNLEADCFFYFLRPVVLTTWREKSRQNNSQEAVGLLPAQPAYGQYTGN